MPTLTRERLGQILRYLTIGVLSLVVDVGGLWLLHGGFGVWLWLAAGTSFLASFFVNFFGNQRFTFRQSGGQTPAQVSRYVVLVAVNTVITSVGVPLIADAGVDYRLAKMALVVVLTAVNFVVLRLWVFKAVATADPRVVQVELTQQKD